MTKLTRVRRGLEVLRCFTPPEPMLGSAVLSIGYPLLASMSIRQIARPFMKELADYANGSVNMGIRDRLNMVYVEACRSWPEGGEGIAAFLEKRKAVFHK